MTFCARCRRQLTREPVIVAGHGYGPVCAGKVSGADLLTPAPRAAAPTPRRRKRETGQLQLEAATQ